MPPSATGAPLGRDGPHHPHHPRPRQRPRAHDAQRQRCILARCITLPGCSSGTRRCDTTAGARRGQRRASICLVCAPVCACLRPWVRLPSLSSLAMTIALLARNIRSGQGRDFLGPWTSPEVLGRWRNAKSSSRPPSRQPWRHASPRLSPSSPSPSPSRAERSPQPVRTRRPPCHLQRQHQEQQHDCARLQASLTGRRMMPWPNRDALRDWLSTRYSVCPSPSL